MIELVYSPNWFFGKDIAIDIVSILVLALIGFFSLRYYKLNRNSNYLCLAASFFLLALSFLFKILTNFTIHYNVIEKKDLGLFTIVYETTKSSNLLFVVGFLAYMLLTLIGLYLLYSIHSEKKSWMTTVLILYLIVTSTYLSRSVYYLFHITALIMLAMIAIQYFRIWKEKKQGLNKILFSSFLIITLSHLLFTLVHLNIWFYVLAELVQLVGYVLLLLTFIVVLKHGKKKR